MSGSARAPIGADVAVRDEPEPPDLQLHDPHGALEGADASYGDLDVHDAGAVARYDGRSIAARRSRIEPHDVAVR
jgi:hypothetical protein